MALPVSGNSIKGTLPNIANGSSNTSFSQQQFGELAVSELNARYAGLVLSGSVFSANFPAAAFAAPSATALGAFALFNPSGSGKNIVLLDVQVALTAWTLVTTTTAAIGILFIPNQTPTSTSSSGFAASTNLIGNGAASIAKGYVSGTTVGAPVLANRIVGTFVLATAVGFGDLSVVDHIDGAVIIAPNSGIQVQAVSGTEADITGIVGLTWAEIPQ